MVVGLVTQREKDTESVFTLLLNARLEERVGGKRRLANCCAHQSWPPRGIYFFFERGEYGRKSCPISLRVVRVGTTTGKHSTLWDRLSQHRARNGTSVFRRHVRVALGP